MSVKNSPVEIEYHGDKRMIYRAKPASLSDDCMENIHIDSDWVILITGGAAGITAEVACELAAKYRPNLILVGRSPFPEEQEPMDTASLISPADIKAVLIEKLRDNGKPPTPAKVESAYARLMKDREIRQNVEKMKKAGAKVYYHQANVQDEQQFEGVIDEIYRKFKRLDGVIHGAGIIEDKLIEDKTPDSFDRVFDTKVDSAFILARKVNFYSLKFMAFFTSVAGCFGNKGQADYAAANEVLNKLAVYLDGQCSGRVVAINWGPWRKLGMVTSELEKKFNELGIQLIPPSAGATMFEQEIRCGNKGNVEVVIGDGPWET
jgi:NAD(P)-dependent dehydrogenase (short-subunit alcohol dehydrogenase family)